MIVISIVKWKNMIITCRACTVRRLLKFNLIIVSIDIRKFLQISIIKMLSTKSKFIFYDFIISVSMKMFVLKSSIKWIFMINLIKWFELFDNFSFMKQNITTYSLILCIKLFISRTKINLFKCLIIKPDIRFWSIFRFSQVIGQSKLKQLFKSITFSMKLVNILTY